MTERTTDEQLAAIKERFGVPAEWVDWDMRFNDPDTALRNDGFAEGHGATLMNEAMFFGDHGVYVTVNDLMGLWIEFHPSGEEEEDPLYLGPYGSWVEAWSDIVARLKRENNH